MLHPAFIFHIGHVLKKVWFFSHINFIKYIVVPFCEREFPTIYLSHNNNCKARWETTNVTIFMQYLYKYFVVLWCISIQTKVYVSRFIIEKLQFQILWQTYWKLISKCKNINGNEESWCGPSCLNDATVLACTDTIIGSCTFIVSIGHAFVMQNYRQQKI